MDFGHVDFNTLYGLAGDEMERIDNEALQRELDRVNTAQTNTNNEVGFNYFDSARLGSDPRQANLAQIEKNYSGGYETLKSTGSYSDFLKAQNSLESQVSSLRSSAMKKGSFGALRNAYGDDTLAAKVVGGNEKTIGDLMGRDEAFSAQIDANAAHQQDARQKAVAARKSYIDDYNKRLEAAKAAYADEYNKKEEWANNTGRFSGNKLRVNPQDYNYSTMNNYADILKEGGMNQSFSNNFTSPDDFRTDYEDYLRYSAGAKKQY